MPEISTAISLPSLKKTFRRCRYSLANVISPDFQTASELQGFRTVWHTISWYIQRAFLLHLSLWTFIFIHVFKIFPQIQNPQVINNKHLLVIFLHLPHSVIYLVALYDTIFLSSWKNVMTRITVKAVRGYIAHIYEHIVYNNINENDNRIFSDLLGSAKQCWGVG